MTDRNQPVVDSLGNVFAWNGEVYTIDSRPVDPLVSDTDIVLQRLAPAGKAEDEATCISCIR